MLTGKAGVSYDTEKEFWSGGMERYYPLGCADPDFALIRFTASNGNYYHGLKNIDFDVTN